MCCMQSWWLRMTRYDNSVQLQIIHDLSAENESLKQVSASNDDETGVDIGAEGQSQEIAQ